MTLQQVFEISAKARALGYSTAVKAGRVQFQTIAYAADGASTIEPRTDWLDYDDAMDILNG
jgi:hypothetical protein